MTYSPWFREISAEYATQPPCKSVHECPAGHVFIGTREAIIGTGHFRAEWFPGEPGMRRHTSTVIDGERTITIQKRSPRLFEATLGYTPDESARREATAKRSRALAALREDLAKLPDCEEAYRCRLSTVNLAYSANLVSQCRGDERTGGYCLDDDSQFELAQLQRRIIEVIHFGKVKLDRARREEALQRVYEVHGEHAPHDEAFAQFMACVSTPGTQLDEGEEPTT